MHFKWIQVGIDIDASYSAGDMQNMQVFVSGKVTGLFLYVMLWANRKHMVALKSVYCLYSCRCVWQWFLVCSWRLGASKICVVFCAGRETPDCVGVRCTDSWQTAAFPVILRSLPRLWPVMRSLWKILLLLGTCLNMSCRYQSNALDIPLEGKLNKWLSALCIICVVIFIFFLCSIFLVNVFDQIFSIVSV